MTTTLKFVAPGDFSIGRVRISNESGLVHDWVATPGNLETPVQPAKPGYYLAEIAPTGVAPQSVIFHVNEGEANNVTVPAFSALTASGSGPNFLGVIDEEAALRNVYRSGPRTSDQSVVELTPVSLDASARRISIGLSQELASGRESYGPFSGDHRYEMVGDRVLIEVEAGEGSDPWVGRRVRLSTSIEGLKVERQLLPMYRGGTTIGISPSALASADVEYQVTPAAPRIRALLRALQAGTSREAKALCETVLNSDGLPGLLSPQTGDPWAAILAGLLFIRFPDSFSGAHGDWVEALSRRVAWAYDTHVIAAHRILSAAGESLTEQEAAAIKAVKLLALAQARGSPYYSYTNQLFGEMAESLQTFLIGIEHELAWQADEVVLRWRREAALQSYNGANFTWLSRDQKALKEKGLLTPMRSPSGQLRARDTTVVLDGVLTGGRIALGRNAKAPKARNPLGPSPAPPARARASYPQLTTSLVASIGFSVLGDVPNRGAKARRERNRSSDDPNKGKFGGKAEVGGFRVDATFKRGPSRDWAMVVLTVTASPDADIELGDVAWFDLHPSFEQRKVKVLFNERRATFSTLAWGGFTVGVWLPRQNIRLECDLAKLKDAPTIIRTR